MENEARPMVTLKEAQRIIKTVAHELSVLLLSPPGIGKSAAVNQAAAAAGLPCTSLLGTQLAPEDVSGIPRIENGRSVFCPPKIILPEDLSSPYCLFLDELPACSPDIQKAFYSLLLERRIGENRLPKGTWVVAAGNRPEDHALVRSLSSALVNRVIILNVKVSFQEWVVWARKNGVRQDILAFLLCNPESLQRSTPNAPVPFSTPRSWTQLSNALTLMEKSGGLDTPTLEALAHGCVSVEDATAFSVFKRADMENLPSLNKILMNPDKLPGPADETSRLQRMLLLQMLRNNVCAGNLEHFNGVSQPQVNTFLQALTSQERAMLMMDAVEKWYDLGACDTFVKDFKAFLELVN